MGEVAEPPVRSVQMLKPAVDRFRRRVRRSGAVGPRIGLLRRHNVRPKRFNSTNPAGSSDDCCIQKSPAFVAVGTPAGDHVVLIPAPGDVDFGRGLRIGEKTENSLKLTLGEQTAAGKQDPVRRHNASDHHAEDHS